MGRIEFGDRLLLLRGVANRGTRSEEGRLEMVSKSSARLFIACCLASGAVLGVILWIFAGRPPELSFLGALGGILSSTFVMFVWRDKLFARDDRHTSP